MAAGIGEASAILSIAQIGISLSKTLITYIEEVRDAPLHIKRIGNEILTTSERLKDIGKLVNQNPHTKVFSEEGIDSAVRCSSECQQIIKEVKNVLCKGGWQDFSKDPDKDEIDPSLFSVFRWPFAKLKLEVPRAELHRIKLDLSLLLSAAMVLGASTTVEKQRLAQDIPGLHKARAWAAKRAEMMKEMARNRPRIPTARDMPWSDDEPEMLEEFLSFKESTFREEEEKRIRECAKIIQAEEDARRRIEEDAQREVERVAVEAYKRTQQEQEARSAAKRDNFRKELERLGFESAQVQMVMESSNLDFQAPSDTAFVPEVRPSPSLRETSGEHETTPSAASSWSRLHLPRWRFRKSTRESSPEPSLSSSLSESSTNPYSWLEIEVWVIDFCTNQNTKILASADWENAKMKIAGKDLEIAWKRFAKLRPHCRNRILEFLNHRREENPGWTLCHFEIPQRWSRTGLFSLRRDEQLIHLTLSKPRLNDQDSDLPRGRLNIEGPDGGFPKRVTFAGERGEESGTEREVKSTRDNAFSRGTSDLRTRIARLEERKAHLRPYDYELIADLNDMIENLRDQLKSDATHTSAQNTTTLYEDRQTEPGRSNPSQAPVIIHEEYIPNSSRRDNIITEQDRYDREPSIPPPPPPRRLIQADDVSVAPYYPRNELEIKETDCSPGQIDPDGRYDARNNGRYGPRGRRGRHEEDYIVGISHDDDWSSPRRWSGRSRSYSGPSPQDPYVTRRRPILIRRDRSWERSKPQTSQPSKHMSKETDYYHHSEGEVLGNGRARTRPNAFERGERSEEQEWYPEMRGVERSEEHEWYPEMREFECRRDERSKSRPRERQYFSALGSEYYYNGSRVPRREPVVDASDQSQALVLRAGASSLPHDYMRERVYNGGIRVRGDDYIGSPPDDSPGYSDDFRARRRSSSKKPVPPEPAVSQYIRKPSRPPTSRTNSYRDQSWAPSLRRRLSETWHQFDSSEDEEFRHPGTRRVDSENNGAETDLSDAEVIAQTLKQLTTIQDSDMPVIGRSAPPTRTKAEVGPSALKNASHASSGPERQRSFPVPGRKAHFDQDIGTPHSDQDGQSRAANEGSKPADEEAFLDRISEEPDAITEDNETPHHQRIVYFPERTLPPRPQQTPSFPLPPDLIPQSREASPRLRSRDPSLDSPRSSPANGPIIIEHHGFTLASQREETPNDAAQEEGLEEVEIIRTISRNPTVHEEVD